ncbi:tRNA lysidine(34) synthetase TilS [Ligilactobacillus salivarius]
MAQLRRRKKIGLFKLDEIELMPGDETLVVEDNENWVIRHRQPGDSLKMSFGNQKIKKVFIDKKFQVNREIRVG